ncbi:MAG TPA: hypothetical protein VM937_02125 [Burkholderiaceae bacterium]|nr:hypothetical protein [Burkholderiaceae bacterium]
MRRNVGLLPKHELESRERAGIVVAMAAVAMQITEGRTLDRRCRCNSRRLIDVTL